MANLDTIEQDYEGTFILNTVEAHGYHHIQSKMVQIYDRAAVPLCYAKFIISLVTALLFGQNVRLS